MIGENTNERERDRERKKRKNEKKRNSANFLFVCLMGKLTESCSDIS